MRNIYASIIVFLLYPCICASGSPGVIEITNENSIKSFTHAEQVWSPEGFERSVFEEQVHDYLKTRENTHFLDYAGDDTKALCEYIRNNLSKYIIEYAGIIKEGRKVIYVNMVSAARAQGTNERFTLIHDGGCSVVTVTYDTVNNEVISLFCNGVA